jgi:hypothetical protein
MWHSVLTMMSSVQNATGEPRSYTASFPVRQISIIVLVLLRVSRSFISPPPIFYPPPGFWGTKNNLELQESPTPERLEQFCRVSEQVTRLAEQSFLRTLERDRYQDMCIADLQEGIENYRQMFDEHLRLVDFVHQQHVLALQKQIELEKRKRVDAENELRKATSTRRGL